MMKLVEKQLPDKTKRLSLVRKGLAINSINFKGIHFRDVSIELSSRFSNYEN